MGKPTCLYGASGNDAMNEYIGYAGRWTCTSANCAGTALSKNRDDSQYVANKAKSGADPTKECIQGYLVFGFFTTDSSRALSGKTLTSDSSYHVLWCNGGVCGLASNTNLNSNGLCAPNDVAGEIQKEVVAH